MKILCYGDSNTYGYDPRDGGDLDYRYPKADRWTGILEERYGFEVVNEGENGRTIPGNRYALAALKETLRRNQDADAVTVMLGSNDLLIGYPMMTAKEIAGRMVRLFERIEEWDLFRAPGKKILLIAPPIVRIPGEAMVNRESDLFAVCFREAAKEVGADFLALHLEASDLAFDGVHLSEAGHQKAAEQIRAALRA